MFSLGCILWELLCGKRLFSGDNDVAVLDALQHQVIVPPSQHNPEVSNKIDEIVLALLRRDPDTRLGSAADLTRRLDLFLQGLGPDVDRATVLFQLYHELFPVRKEKTSVFSLNAEPTGVLELGRESTQASLQPKEVELKSTLKASLYKLPGYQYTSVRWVGLAILLGLVVVLVLLFAFPSPNSSSSNMNSTQVPAWLAEETSQVETKESLMFPTTLENNVLDTVSDLTKNNHVREEVQLPVPQRKEEKIELGRLNLNAIPWAKVYWQKKFLGATPIQGKLLPAGKQRLVLINEKLKIRKTISVRIRAGVTTKRVIDLSN